MKRVERLSKPCGVCGATMKVRPLVNARTKFCSRSCAAKHHAPAKLRPNTKPTRTSYRKGDNLGAAHPRWKERIQFVCEFCDQPFGVVPWQARQKGQKNRFCSAVCRSRFRSVFLSGPNAPDYVGGETTYRGPDWPEARAAVIVDQKGFCAHCRVFVGKSLPVHHIRSYRLFASSVEANVRSNLIGLCQSCHMKEEHRTASAPEPPPPSHSSPATA